MTHTVQPALVRYLGVPGYFLTLFILIAGLALFLYIIYRRFQLLRAANPDIRFDSLRQRFSDLVVYGILQWRQPQLRLREAS